MPTTEELLGIEKEIQRLLERKRRADLHLIDLEARIYALESEYLRETHTFGSLIQGLEGYLGTVNVVGRRPVTATGAAGERVFSGGSASWQRALGLYARLVKEATLPPMPLPHNRPIRRGLSGAGDGLYDNGPGGSGTRRPQQINGIGRPRGRKRASADPAWSGSGPSNGGAVLRGRRGMD